jgi:hypothetical protein
MAFSCQSPESLAFGSVAVVYSCSRAYCRFSILTVPHIWGYHLNGATDEGVQSLKRTMTGLDAAFEATEVVG